MFGYNEIKKSINDWVQDIAGKYENILPILKEITNLIEEILNIWRRDTIYREYNQKINILQFRYTNFDKFYQEFIQITQNSSSAKTTSKLFDEKTTKLILIRDLSNKYNYSLPTVGDLQAFMKNLQEYQQLVKERDAYKLELIKEHVTIIFRNCLMISSYQKKYPELYQIIGCYNNVEEYLGFGGSKILSGDSESLTYINNLEILLDKIEEEKNRIELSYQGRRR